MTRALGIGFLALLIGFVIGVEVETNYCKSYYEGFKR